MSDLKAIRRALVSVYDKDRLLELGQALSDANIEILSTGSTAKTLAQAGIVVTEVSAYTEFPEIMGGRVKTLHPRIHSGILADQENPEHLAAIAELGIAPFDLVVINLYPFAETIASGADFAECIEQIDIGGPSMLRGAAKNHGSVAVVSSVSQYDQIITAIKAGGTTLEERRNFALQVFRTTAEYDLTIASWLGSQNKSGTAKTLYVTVKIRIKVRQFIQVAQLELLVQFKVTAKKCHLIITLMPMPLGAQL